MTLKKPDAILFDWDGTLVESLKAIHAAHNVVLTNFGHRALSYEDIFHYQKIIVALTETDRMMKEIDKIGVV